MIRSGAVHGQGNRRVFHGAGAGVSDAGEKVSSLIEVTILEKTSYRA